MERRRELQDLVRQYQAEPLPSSVSGILADFFLKKLPLPRQEAQIDGQLLEQLVAKSVANGKEDLSIINHVKKNDGIIMETFTEANCSQSVTNLEIPNGTIMCDRAFEQYFADGCGCARECHRLFPRKVVFEAHLDALDLDRYCQSHVNHQHLLLLGALNALMKNSTIQIEQTSKHNSNKDRVNSRTFFKFRGQDVCRRFFLFVFGCGERRLKNLMKHFIEKGLLPNSHENAGATKAIIKTNPRQLRSDALTFILNYGQQNGLQLPGRYVVSGGVYLDLFLLPNQANLSRREIYERYTVACSEVHSETVSFALWNELWDISAPNVLTLHDRGTADVCCECRQYKKKIGSRLEATLEGNEGSEIKTAQAYLEHLNTVQAENDAHKATLERCREDYEELMKKTDLESTIRHSILPSILPSMHYTLDWYSAISLPFTDSTTTRHSSLYFKSTYKVALFGITIEPIQKYILYILPEFLVHKAENLQNITISILHHLFGSFPFNEKEAMVRLTSNSTEQAKNASLISYFAWRTLCGYQEKISVSYGPPGHTRAWSDMFMGVFKKKLRNCSVNSLQELKAIAERCTLERKSDSGSCIQAFLVGNDNEEVVLPLYNWSERLRMISKLNPKILEANQHYQLDIELPGYILCQKTVTDDRVSYKLIKNEDLPLLEEGMPAKLELEALPHERRVAIFESIKPYLEVLKKSADSAKLWTCDQSVSVTSNSGGGVLKKSKKKKRALTAKASETASETKKSTPRCSYCNEVGHRESNFGKVSCPKKKADCALLEQQPIVHQIVLATPGGEGRQETGANSGNTFENQQLALVPSSSASASASFHSSLDHSLSLDLSAVSTGIVTDPADTYSPGMSGGHDFGAEQSQTMITLLETSSPMETYHEGEEEDQTNQFTSTTTYDGLDLD